MLEITGIHFTFHALVTTVGPGKPPLTDCWFVLKCNTLWCWLFLWLFSVVCVRGGGQGGVVLFGYIGVVIMYLFISNILFCANLTHPLQSPPPPHPIIKCHYSSKDLPFASIRCSRALQISSSILPSPPPPRPSLSLSLSLCVLPVLYTTMH